MPRGPPTGAPGSSAKPLAGADLEARAGALEGQVVHLPRSAEGVDFGPRKIEGRIGGGEFGHLYKMEGEPGLFKVPTNNPGAAEAMARQAQGFDLIKNAPEIPSPKILARGPGHPGEPPYLQVESLFEGEWAKKGAYLKKAEEAFSGDEVRAAKELYDNLAKRDLVWLDGHKGNVFFFREGGRVRAGVLDHDMIMRSGDVAKIGRRQVPTAEFLEEKLFQDLIGHPAMRTAADGVSGKPFDHKGWMDGRFQRWFGEVPPERPPLSPRPPAVAAAPPAAPRPPMPDAPAAIVRPPAGPEPSAPTVRMPGPGQPGAPDAPTVRMPASEAPTVRVPASEAPTVRLPGPEAPTVRMPASEAPTVRMPGPGQPGVPGAPSARMPGSALDTPTVGSPGPVRPGATPPTAGMARGMDPPPPPPASSVAFTPPPGPGPGRAAARPDAPRGPPPAGGPGSPERPLAGNAITASAESLEHNVVSLPRTADGRELGPVRLGERVGGGYFGTQYRMADQPDKLAKIIHNADGGPASIGRQVAGHEALLQHAPDIPMPRILGHRQGGPGEPSYLIVENLRAGKWADKAVTILPEGSRLTRAQTGAMRELYRELGEKGLVWADGHAANAFFFMDKGKLRAGILDHDTLFPAGALNAQDAWIEGLLTRPLFRTPDMMNNVLDGWRGAAPFNARSWMDNAFRARFEPASLP